MSDQERDLPTNEDPHTNAEHDSDAVSQDMWSAVRDRDHDDVLTGEEVHLDAAIGHTEEIIGGVSDTTIPAMTSETPEDSTTPQAVPADEVPDVLANREAHSYEPSETEDTIVQRRSLLSSSAETSAEEDSTDSANAAWHSRESSTPDVLPAVSASATTGSALGSLDDALFEGASIIPEMPSRTGAHWASFCLVLLLTPVAWFFASDAGARMAVNPAGAANTGNLAVLPLVELLTAVVLGFVIVALILRSSLGAWFTGILVTCAGLPWLIVPGTTKSLIEGPIQRLEGFHPVTANLAYHLQQSGFSGRMLLLGLVLLAFAWLSHSGRRRGRRDEALRAEVATVNPAGAHFSARARRKAAKALGMN